MSAMNHVIGTAIRNMGSSWGAISTKGGQMAVSTAANAAVETVARWFRRYPIWGAPRYHGL